MALQNLIGYLQFPTVSVEVPTASTPTNMLLDAANEKASFCFTAIKTGNITIVAFSTNVVTTGAIVDVRLETLDITTGNPSGNLASINSNASVTILDANDSTWFTATLTAPAAVTIGIRYALVIVNPAVSPGNLNIGGVVGYPAIGISSYCDLFTSSWLKQTNGSPVAYLEYDDGTSPNIGFSPSSPAATIAFNSGSTPDERGMYFKFPFKCKLGGADIGNTPSGDYTVILYDSDGSTILASYVVDASSVKLAFGLMRVIFTTPVTLEPNTFYRITVRPDTVTNVTIYEMLYLSTLAMQQIDGGSNFIATNRTNQGAWTEINTRRSYIHLLISALDDGVSSGSGGSGGNSGGGSLGIGF